MSSGVVKVNPVSVRQYGAQAQSSFAEIHRQLKELVDCVVEVRYKGPNAVNFKTKTGEIAAEFANQANRKMQEIATAVKSSTSNISTALGGQPIDIGVDSRTIAVPTVAPSDVVELDSSALLELKSVVSRKFDEINVAFKANYTSLCSTDWEGTAKNSATSTVKGITDSANAAALAAEQAINKAIQAQIDAVEAADN